MGAAKAAPVHKTNAKVKVESRKFFIVVRMLNVLIKIAVFFME
jgi:hypothetical protein